MQMEKINVIKVNKTLLKYGKYIKYEIKQKPFSEDKECVYKLNK